VLHGTRLVCPWHGACFNATTGDVENAPALDSLATYELHEKNGAVYVSGDESVLKENFPNPLSPKCQAHGGEKVVIVGG
jgi:phenylpropionate dioxygenase-like ring-hydroxylating dioxygenase large terminal subunit